MSEAEVERSWALRGASEVVRVETVSRERVMTIGTGPQRIANGPGSDAPPRRDWAAALTLVQEAAESIRLSEERVEGLQFEAEQQAQRHHEELLALHQQLQNAQREIENANTRARAAEQRAREATDWLVKLDDAINANFGVSAG